MRSITLYFQGAILFLSTCCLTAQTSDSSVSGIMMFGDTSRTGSPFSKDPHVIYFAGRYLMYYSIPPYRNKNVTVQGVAVADANSGFGRGDWKNLSFDGPILKPELPWEKDCVEGASVIKKGRKLYMFYAGAYNNAPQQIGVAVSKDAVTWKRLSEDPFLANGKPGEWNSSESGHPHIFRDKDGKTYLFFQGNNDNGKTWFISKIKVRWNKSGPYLQAIH